MLLEVGNALDPGGERRLLAFGLRALARSEVGRRSKEAEKGGGRREGTTAIKRVTSDDGRLTELHSHAHFAPQSDSHPHIEGGLGACVVGGALLPPGRAMCVESGLCDVDAR